MYKAALDCKIGTETLVKTLATMLASSSVQFCYFVETIKVNLSKMEKKKNGRSIRKEDEREQSIECI